MSINHQTADKANSRTNFALQATGLTALLTGFGMTLLAGCGTSGTGGTSVVSVAPGAATTRRLSADCGSMTGTPEVVCYANQLYSSSGLSTTQQSALEIAFTQANAVNWNNIPIQSSQRLGLAIGDLTTAQQTAFLNVVKAALNLNDNAGYFTYTEIREADDWLNTNGNNAAYSSAIYHIAFLGAPSNTSAWELQMTGHHSIYNIVYNGLTVTANATPNFEGVEPNSYNSIRTPVKIPTGETTETSTIQPMDARRDAMYNLFSVVSTSSKASTAKLSTTFSDVKYGPSTDTSFPNQAHEGAAISSFTATEQATIIPLVQTAMNTWVNCLPESQAAVLRSLYQSTSAMQGTYLAYSLPNGTTSVQPILQGVYYRIDGPNCWIEFVVQNGVVISSQVHYHSIWRDHKLDYGGQFSSVVRTTNAITPKGGVIKTTSSSPIPLTTY